MILVGPQYVTQAQLDAAIERLTSVTMLARDAAHDEDAARAFALRVRDFEPAAYTGSPFILWRSFLRLWAGYNMQGEGVDVRNLPTNVLRDGAPVSVLSIHDPDAHPAALLLEACGALSLLGIE
jgi:hypothetical protein